MAATAADIRSILSIPDPLRAGPSQSKKNPTTNRKPEGLPREVYSLIGPSTPTLAVQLAKPRLKQKPNLGAGNKSKWELRAFKNNARNDGLQLKHWVKASTAPNADYPFAKYNVQTVSYTYSQDEYTRFLEDKDWTKEETDYLFRIAQEYDTRWYIVHDRYEYPRGQPRTIEDLKDRYYSVCRKLVRNRPWAGDEASKNQLMASFQFDKDREIMRKKYLANLDSRTPEQVVEEEALYIEIKRLEQNERKFRRDRDELLRTLGGIDSGLPDIVKDDITALGVPSDVKRKKKGGTAMDLDSPSTPSISAANAPIAKRPQNAKNVAYDAQHCIIRTDTSSTTPATKAAHQPAYLRSFKLPVPKPSLAPKITQALAELGISHTRLVMPTRENCAQLEALLDATVSLVDQKRAMDKVEYDILVEENRLNRRNTQAETGEVAAAPTEAMDVDEPPTDAAEGDGDEEADDGRAQSVVSTRSIRSRKHARRSVSVSSVDTNGTVLSTRAGKKRQKRG